MIRLTKKSEPKVLVDNKTLWLSDLNAELAQGIALNKCSNSKKYNHSDIKNILMEESHGKCIYCESKVRHVDHGEIEHIKPKSMFIIDIFNWNNLGFSCAKCNNAKGNKYNASVPTINPFIDNPGVPQKKWTHF